MTQQSSARQSRRWKAPSRMAVVMLPALMAGGLALAQQVAPSPEALNKADAKAQRESDKVFKWILINADRPKRPAAEAKPAAAPAPKPVAKAHEPKDDGIVEKVEPIVAHGAPPAPPQKALAKNTPPAAPAGSGEPAAREALGHTPAPTQALAEQAPAPTTAQAAASAPSDQLAMAAPKAKAPEVPPPAAEEEDEQLQLVKQVDPEFPRSLIERLEKGAVQVRFDVNPDGSVSSASVVKTSHPRLNDAAMAAVSQWRFKPLHHKQTGIVELKFDLAQ